MRNRFGLGIVLATALASFVYAQPFTYQGMLKQNGNPANGTLNMTFKLYDALTGGNQIGSPITQNVAVQNGLFTVNLDFGNVWDGADRYLEIAVGSTVLSPRVKINPTPYALYCANTRGLNVDNNGNVGIGTSSPATRLSLGGENANTKLALWQGPNAGDLMGFGIGSGQFRLHLHQPSNRFSFLNAPNGTEIFTIFGNGNLKLADDRSITGLDQLVGYNDLRLYGDANGGPDLYIAPDGKVGIGTSSPATRLSLGGGEANTKLALWQGSGANDLMGFGVGSGQFRIHLPNSSNRFSFLDAPNGTEIVTIQGNGNVGIGTSSPQARLHVNGSAFITGGSGPTTLQILPGQLMGDADVNTATLDISGTTGRLGIWDSLEVDGYLAVRGNHIFVGGGTDWANRRRVELRTESFYGGGYAGIIKTYGTNNSENVSIHAMLEDPRRGGLTINDENSDWAVAMGVVLNAFNQPVGFLAVRGGKAFVTPDPDDPTRDIWYGCIEGPELAMYTRGTARLVNGRARIELPDHFRKLADEQGMTVQLTPRSGESKGLAAVRVSLDGIEVVELHNGRGNYEFDWRVEAVRKEFSDYQVYRSWDAVMPAGKDPAEAWEARMKSIQARQEHRAHQQAQNTKP